MSDVARAEDSAGTDIPGEVEAKARDMGWRPEDEWEGDKSGWMDADAFVGRQDKRRAIVTEEVKVESQNLKAEIAALKTEQAETRQTIEDFKGWQTKAEERIYKKALKDIQTKQREAVESGDTVAFDAAQQEADALVKETEKPAEVRRVNPDELPAYKAWHAKNAWYNTDLKLTREANAIGPEISRIYGLTPEMPAFYDKITEQLKEEFPDKFENPNRKRADAVEEGGGGNAKGGKTAADLPAEDRKIGERFVKQGLFKDLKAYAKDYWQEEE